MIRPLFRRLTRVLVARRIEKEIPGIHNRLVSCVDFSDAAAGHAHSMAFHRRLVNEAVERIREFRLQKVIDLLSLRRSGIFMGAGIIALILIFAIFPNRLSTAMARIFHPFADIPPASGVVYDVLLGDRTEPGDYETLRGELIDFTVVLKQGEVDPPGGEDPLRLEVNTVDDDGQRKQLSYYFGKLDDDQTTFQLMGMQNSFTYRVYGGGTWTREMKVTLLDRPRIIGLQTILHYPKYMRISEPRFGPPQTADVAGPKESTVEITIDVEGDATEGEIQLLQLKTKTVDVLKRPQRAWFTDQIPQGAAADGKWEFDEKLTGKKAHTDAANKEAHAHGFHGAPIGFEVQPGESLFADVYLIADQMPETIMLKWHDGQGWEHRAYWGADKISEGKPDTPSRLHMGDLPQAGQFVRLEVPAKSLDLEGKRLHGISFALFGGKCLWGAAGTLPAAQKQATQLVVTESVLLHRVDQPAGDQTSDDEDSEEQASKPQKWKGTFPLMRDGFYRVVLRNKLKYPNRQMKEGKLTAIRDNPPQVAIERPGTDLLLSSPVKVPIYLSAFDDFGIDIILLSVQNGENNSFQGRPVKQYEIPQRSETMVLTLDLAEEKLKVGDTLRYRVEVRDCRGQNATTRDYTIRLADDNNAADRQFAQFEQKTDTFQEKLLKLIGAQKKIQEAVEKLTEKYKPMSEKIERAKVEAIKKLANADPNKPIDPAVLKPEDVAKAMELDEDTNKALQELRGKLGEVSKLETQNIQLGQQVANELAELAKQAPNQQLLPPEIAKQLEAVQKAFQQMAVQPMQDLNALMQKGTQAANKDPQLAEVERQGKQLQRNLEDLKDRMQALLKAQKESQNDIDKALADLRSDLTRQNAQMTARELADLKNFIEAMRKDLKNLQGVQEDLLTDNSKDLSVRLFEMLKKVQEKLDEETDKELAEARKVLNSEELRRLRDRPLFPNRPYDPQRDEYLVPPKEQDTEEPDDNAKDKQKEDAKQKKDEADEEEDRPLFMPVLGGPIPKLDPRFKDKIRKLAKAAKKKKKGSDDEEDPREQLRSRQASRVEELDLAEQALGSDQQSLEKMLEQLQAAAADPDQARQLAQMMKSMNMRQAQAMLRRMQQMLSQAQSQQPNQPPAPSENLTGLLTPVDGGTEFILVEFEDLDLNARTVIMKMQPRVREELLQGLREEGPEGYRRFIRDYFRRLTKVKATEKK